MFFFFFFFFNDTATTEIYTLSLHDALPISRVALSELVSAVRATLESDLQDRTVEWRIGELPTVTGDPAMLRLVLANLLGNAVKYTGGRPVASIEVDATKREGED